MRHSLSFWSDPWRPTQDWFALSPVFGSFLDDDKTSKTHVPACEVEERKDSFLVTLDMPGVNREEIKLEVVEGKLRVVAERKQEKSEQKDARYFSERHYGRFERIFELGEHIDADRIEAAYEDGVLKIVLAKTPLEKPRTIPVKEGAKGGLFDGAPTKEKALN